MRALIFLRSNARWLGAGGLLTLLSCFGQTFFISIFAGHIQADYGLSHGEWGGIYTVGTMVSAGVMVWAGTQTDVYRARALGAAILALLAVTCVFMGLNTSVLLLPLVIFLLRFSGQGMLGHISAVAMSRWFQSNRGKALSVAGLGFSIGEAFLPVIFVSLFAFVDWRVLWVICGAIALAAIPVLFALLKTERTPQTLAQEVSSFGMKGRYWSRKDVLGHKLFWFIIPALLGPSAFGTAFFFHQVHFADIKGWSHLDLTLLFPIYTSVAVGSMILSGALLDRFGTPRLMPWIQIPLVLAFVCFGISQDLSITLLGMILMGLSHGANATILIAFWAEFYGTKHIGAIKSLATAIMVLGSAIGPGLTGALIDLNITLSVQYIWVGGYFCLASILMLIGVTRYKDDLA